MNKKILAMFRKLLALDIKALPDSISSEDFSKLIEESAGKLFIKPEDFKNLQKTLSAKDVDLKKITDELKVAQEAKAEKMTESEKMITDLKKTVDLLSESITAMRSQVETEALAKNYPDILPELLVGKTPEQVEAIVTRQREINKKLYGDSTRFAPPDYSSEAEIDEKVESIKADKKISGVGAAVEVLNLSRKRAALPQV